MKKLLSILFVLITTTCYALQLGGVTAGGVRLDNAKKQLLPVGDSLTAGVGHTEYWSFRKDLQELQGIEYEFVGIYDDPASDPTYSVYHDGVPGMSSYEIEDLMAGYLSVFDGGANSTNSIVLLQTAGNDNLGTELGRQTCVDNVEDIIDIVHAYNPDITIYVANFIPSELVSVYDQDDVVTYNALLEPMLASYHATKSNLHYVDMWSAMYNDEFGFCSGDWEANCYYNASHPNNDGYKTMAYKWYECMEDNSASGCDGN